MSRFVSRASLLILSLVVTAGARADSVSLNLSFEAKQQSIWGRGSAAPPSARTYTLVDPNVVKWNYATPDYPALKPGFVSVDTFFWGDVDFGFGGRAGTNGHVGLFATLTVTEPGSVDVTYPVAPVLTFPDANSFRAGDTIEIHSSYDRSADWELRTASPVVQFSLDTDTKIYGDLHAKICFVACADTTGLLSVPSPTINFDVPSGTGGTFNLFTVRTGDRIETPPQLGLLVPFSGSAAIPQTTARVPTRPPLTTRCHASVALIITASSRRTERTNSFAAISTSSASRKECSGFRSLSASTLMTTATS